MRQLDKQKQCNVLQKCLRRKVYIREVEFVLAGNTALEKCSAVNKTLIGGGGGGGCIFIHSLSTKRISFL